VVVRAPRAFVDQTPWPEYLALSEALHSYLNEATEGMIREEVYKDRGEATEPAG
jgi:hypothetical protein